MPYGQTDPDTRCTLHTGIVQADLHPLYGLHPHCILSTRGCYFKNRAKNTQSLQITLHYSTAPFLLTKLK